MTPSQDPVDLADPSVSAPAPRKPWLQALKEADAKRPDFPGEHAIVLGVGVLLLLSAGRSRSVIGKLAKAAAGGALVGRAASGTGGVARLAQTIATFTNKLPLR
ncbi:MAG: hypothetical protein AAGD03_13985 [Bordetella sp.]|nr:hypothetical protein [Pseudomonadota bacterium]